jgi:hypothetical protein
VVGTYSDHYSCTDGSSAAGSYTITVRGDETAISGDARGSGGCSDDPLSVYVYSFSGHIA